MEELSSFNLFAGWGLIALVLLMAIFGFYMIVAFRIKPLSKPLFPFLGHTSEEVMKQKLHDHALWLLDQMELYEDEPVAWRELLLDRAKQQGLGDVDKHGDFWKSDQLKNYEKELK